MHSLKLTTTKTQKKSVAHNFYTSFLHSLIKKLECIKNKNYVNKTSKIKKLTTDQT